MPAQYGALRPEGPARALTFRAIAAKEVSLASPVACNSAINSLHVFRLAYLASSGPCISQTAKANETRGEEVRFKTRLKTGGSFCSVMLPEKRPPFLNLKKRYGSGGEGNGGLAAAGTPRRIQNHASLNLQAHSLSSHGCPSLFHCRGSFVL